MDYQLAKSGQGEQKGLIRIFFCARTALSDIAVIQFFYAYGALKSFLKVGSIQAVDADSFASVRGVNKLVVADINAHMA